MADGTPRPERGHAAERGYDPPAAPGFDESAVAFLGAARVAHLATSDLAGAPHVVPVCFAFDPAVGTCYVALDAKPKRVAVRRLRRVRNILANPQAALLVDRYDEDWTRLGWCLVHAAAALLDPAASDTTAEHAAALTLLRAKYPQYRSMPLEAAPIIVLRATRVSVWTGDQGSGIGDRGSGGWDQRSGIRGQETGDESHSVLGTQHSALASHSALSTQPSALRGALDFFGLVRGRRSVRVYAPTPVARPVVERILEAARWAPSPHGRLPWRFVVLTVPAAKETLAAAMGVEWRRNLAMDEQPDAVVDIRLAKSYQRLLAAPVLIVPCLYEADLDQYPDPARQAAERVMAIQSVGAAAQNILLAAYSLGLDAGWMCAPLFCPDAVRAALGLDISLWPQAILTLGYATATPRRRARLPLADLILRYE